MSRNNVLIDIAGGSLNEAAGAALRDIPGRLLAAGLPVRVLCVFKGMMLVGFRQYLFDAHWRVWTPTYSWANNVWFYLFLLLAGAHLWTLARRCEELGTLMVGAANSLVLALGALFIALTFHEGDQSSSPAPVWNPRASGDRLVPRRKPVLPSAVPSLWLAGYAAAFCIMARTGRERLLLRMTTVWVVVYAALCLRELRCYGDELIVMNAVGVVCLLGARRRGPPLSPVWMLVRVVDIVFIYFLFGTAPSKTNLNQ